jgi:hypothetical protein
MTATGAGLFGDARLLDVHDVHDDAAFEHLGEAEFEASISTSLAVSELPAPSGREACHEPKNACV